MKSLSQVLAATLAVGTAIALFPAAANAATASAGDILVGFRATDGTGSTKNLMVNLGSASTLEAASSSLSLGNIGADLSSTYGAAWSSRASLYWGAAGTTGSFAPIGANPAKTLFGSRTLIAPWTRQNVSTQAAATNKMVGLITAFNLASSAGLINPNAALQNSADINSWGTYQPGGTLANSGPVPGTSFAFFNPSIEGSFASGPTGAILRLHRIKPATTGAEIDTPGDYLGLLYLNSSGDLTFQPASVSTAILGFASTSATASEADGSISITVERSGDLTVACEVSVSVSGGTAAPADYSPLASGSVSFGVGDTSKTLTLDLANRPGVQGNRSIILTLSNPVTSILGANASFTLNVGDSFSTSTVEFASSSLRVNAESGNATVNLVRSGGSEPVEVVISTSNGSAGAGTDFIAPAANTRVSFGQDVYSVSFPISLTSAAITNNRVFIANINRPADAPSYLQLGSVASMSVTLLAQDSTAPQLAFSAPAANLRIEEPQSNNVQVSLIASDNVNLERVEVSLNAGSFAPANLSSGRYIRNVTLLAGINTIVARATDSRGNLTSLSRNVTYVRKGSLSVVTNPADGSRGTVGTITRLGSAVPVTGGNFETGTTYVVRATPKSGFAFANWTVPGLGSDSSTRVPTLIFTYTEAIRSAPTLTANFLSSPFADSKVGEFSGLVNADAGFVKSNSSFGHARVTLTNRGSFTGSLMIDGFKLTLPAGNFNATGLAYFGTDTMRSVRVERLGKPAIELSSLNWDEANDRITGSITLYQRRSVISRSVFALKRAAFSSKNLMSPTSPYLRNGGNHSLVVPAAVQSNGLEPQDYPQGHGQGTLRVTNLGVISLAAKLADDTTVTLSAPISNGNSAGSLEAALFVQIYGNKGSFGGQLLLDSTRADSDMRATLCQWYRPWQSAMQWYPWGWEEGLLVDLYAASYNPTQTGGVIAGLPASGIQGNAELTLAAGLLAEPLVGRMSVSTANAVTLVGGTGLLAPTSYSVVITPSSGAVAGFFTHSTGAKVNYSARVYQKGPLAGVYGYFLSPKPVKVDGLGEAGAAEILPPQP